jgi:hypothetical protein
MRWMLNLLTSHILSGAAGRHRELELDESIFGRCRDLFQRALQGGGCLRREALMTLLNENTLLGIMTRALVETAPGWQMAK